MKLLAFAASNSRASINRAFLDHAASRFRAELDPDGEIEILDLNDFEMPIYSIDREREGGVPSEARTFFDAIGRADAVLASFAEHNGCVSAAWKNVYDWMSRIDARVWQGKPILIMAATPGPRAGAGVLQGQVILMPHFGGRVAGSIGIGRWPDAFDTATGTLVDDVDRAELGDALASLAHFARDSGA